ncbi:MAG: hypothetical protein E7561_01690 [Ruminococcaceae bacterium]|nr:hypothetical protein [Oscillospiraceae bacterium]
MFKNAKWIYYPECTKGVAPIFKKTFTVEKAFKKAEITITGLGFYKLRVNGKAVSDELLTPPVTSYDKTVIYQVYDLTEFLNVGENEITVTLGNGLYNESGDTAWYFNYAPWRGRPRMICEITVDDEVLLSSNSKWLCAESKTIFNEFREGETYDANKEQVWTKASVANSPGGILKKQTMPPVRVREVIEGKKINSHIYADMDIYADTYDFGVNLTGNVEITVKGKKGDVVKIEYSERLRDDFTVDIENITNGVFTGRFATDNYILSGDGEETWHSDFMYNGFRYVRITNNFSAELVSVRAKGYHTDLETIGNFTTDNERVNKLHEAVRRSTLTNYIHIPTDCPHREKNGWTADAYLSSEQAQFNFNMTDSYLKWLDDIVDCQRPNGAIPGIVPNGVWGFEWGNGPTWDAVLTILPWNIYLYTGRKDVLERYYENIYSYIKFLVEISDEWIWYYGLGDWGIQGIDDGRECMCDISLVLTAYADYIIKLYGKMSVILGNTERANEMAGYTENIKKAFKAKYSELNTNSQTYLSLLLYFHLCDNEEEVLDLLVKRLEKDDYHIRCGIFGSLFVPEVLTEHGRFQDAWKVVTKEGYSGWMYYLDVCSGTLGENWFGATSQNHHMYSHVDGFIWHNLVGIRPDVKAPGFKNIILEPHIPEGMKEFSAWYNMPTGKFEISLKDNTLNVTIPQDSTASFKFNGIEKTLNAGEHSFTV